MKIEKFYNATYTWLINYGPRFLIGMLVLFVGLWLIKLLLNRSHQGMHTKAAFFVMQEAARLMSDNGRIINMGTTILGATIPNYSVYAGAKAPLEDFTRALAKEIGHRGITVNVVAPGPIDTAFYHEAETTESESRAAQASVAQRLGKIEDIVPVIDFLTSEGSQWVTAQTIFVNGGYLAR